MSTGCPITSSGNNAIQEKQCKNNQALAILQAKVDANRMFDPIVQETKVNLIQGFCGCNSEQDYNDFMKKFGTISLLGILAIILFKAK